MWESKSGGNGKKEIEWVTEWTEKLTTTVVYFLNSGRLKSDLIRAGQLCTHTYTHTSIQRNYIQFVLHRMWNRKGNTLCRMFSFPLCAHSHAVFLVRLGKFFDFFQTINFFDVFRCTHVPATHSFGPLLPFSLAQKRAVPPHIRSPRIDAILWKWQIKNTRLSFR